MGCSHSSRHTDPEPLARSISVDDTSGGSVNRQGQTPSATPARAAVSTQERPNAPLRMPRAFRAGPDTPRLRSALTRERQAFFETRVTGRAEAWQAVRVATELVRDRADLSTAQGVLDAAGLTVPRGRLEEGVWDELGQLYRVENWVIRDPRDVIEDDGADADDEDEDDGVDDASAADEKEGTVATNSTDSSGRQLKVRVRLSDKAQDVVVMYRDSQNVSALQQAVREHAVLPASTTLRLAYMGRVLKPGKTLADQDWHEGHIISGFVSQAS